ncbi:hypothetical protein M569_05551, partial [Genlisea aurea]
SSMDGLKTGMHDEQFESIIAHSKKIQDDVQEQGESIKHHEENIKYLKSLEKKLESSLSDIQVRIGRYPRTEFLKGKSVDPEKKGFSKEDIVQRVTNYKNSAASLLCRIKATPGSKSSEHSSVKDVLGVVATLGKVNDANISRILAEYLGQETMLAVVCKTEKGVKAMEAYNSHGLIDKGFGIHSLAASMGKSVDERFLVICLEDLRPYSGGLICDDPLRRLDLMAPRLANGENPPGFLGFAVNMIAIESTELYTIVGTGYSLRETLFYNLFSDLQVYKSREDMLKARPCITHSAVSLDGGMIRNLGISAFGPRREGMDIITFPCDPPGVLHPAEYLELQKESKETEWKKNRTLEDLKKEEELLNLASYKYEEKKREFVEFLATSSSYAAAQLQMQHGSAT